MTMHDKLKFHKAIEEENKRRFEEWKAANVKTFEVDDVEVLFWYEGATLFCRVHDMGSEIYCCGSARMPENEADVLKITETAWVW